MEKSSYREYKKVSLFLYSYFNQELHLLLQNDNNKLIHINSYIEDSDNTPIHAISRHLTATFKGLFSQENMSLFPSNDEFNLIKTEINCFNIWELTAFQDWLDLLSSNPIQYDELIDEIIYFVEIPMVDIMNLNKRLKPLEIKFEYIKYSSDIKESIDVSTFELFNKFDFDTHIKNTKTDCNYIIFAIKPPASKTDQAGFFHFPALFTGLYRRNNEKWLYIVSCADEYPGQEILKDTKAIIIPGSHLNVYNEFDFINKTQIFLVDVYKNYPSIRFLGLCFGLQILVKAFGGKVEKMQRDFVSGLEKINFVNDFLELDFVKKSGISSNSLNIFQAHGDEVTFLTDDFINIGYSESCVHEALVSKDNRIFCFQGHPEYKLSFTINRAAPFWCIRRGLEQNIENFYKIKDELLNNVEKYKDSHHIELRTICYNFIKDF